MDKTGLKYMIDAGLIFSFLVIFITGLLKFKGVWIDVSELPIAQISTVHDWFGIVFGLLVLAHLSLNLGWLKCTTKNLLKGGDKKCDTT